MAEVKEPQKKSRKGAAGLFIPAGLLIGMGIGFATGNIPGFMFIGLGAGFLIFALVMVIFKD